MTKTQLREAVGFSTSTLAKMSKGEYVSLETIDIICQYLDCRVEEVVEILQTPLLIDKGKIVKKRRTPF